ncbi:hypothetical protein FRC19_002546 [Serendipita sp. 401]|nr:hypothetical protein FRC19_002546 [Serendipita sp. 401]
MLDCCSFGRVFDTETDIDDVPKPKRVPRPKSPFVFQSTPSPKQSIKVYRDPNLITEIYATEMGLPSSREPRSAPTTRNVRPAEYRIRQKIQESPPREIYKKQLAAWGVDLPEDMFREDPFEAGRNALRRTVRANSVGVLEPSITHLKDKEKWKKNSDDMRKKTFASVQPVNRSFQPLLPAISLEPSSLRVPEENRQRSPLSSPEQSSDEAQSPSPRSSYRPVYKEWIDSDDSSLDKGNITYPNLQSHLETPENRHVRPYKHKLRNEAAQKRVLTPRSNTPTL